MSASLHHQGNGLSSATGQDNSGKLVIGIDFGTTYSGISWAFSETPEDIYTIKCWPTRGNTSYAKVPTEISYNGTCTIGGRAFPFEWGFKAQRDEDRIKFIKLLLDPMQNFKIDGLSELTDRSAAKIPRGKSACDVVTDYLTALRYHLHEQLANKLGREVVDILEKEYVFTVPAIWSDKAKALTERAAKAAGFVNEDGEILLVPEPEAAALCCLKTLQPNTLKLGDKIMIIDCGGGTVDIISYEILNLKPLELRESAVGDGDLCGSIILNDLFEKMLKNKIGIESYDALKPVCKRLILDHFDDLVKRSFTDDEEEDGELFIQVPGVDDDLAAGIEDGLLQLTAEDMRTIFRPSLNRIENLIEGQRNQIYGEVNMMLLVGGFGSSRYLLKHFQAWGEQRGIEVLQPVDAWSCIVRGAVMAGLQRDDEVVKQKLARRSYGVMTITPFIDGRHRKKYKFWHEQLDEWYCSQSMQWFIRKGDDIGDGIPIEHNFCRDSVVSQWTQSRMNPVTDYLFAFDGDKPPEYSDNMGVYKVTTLTSHLASIPYSAWEKTNRGDKEGLMTLSYQMRMVLHGAMLTFQLLHDGKPYGIVVTKFE